MLWKNNISPRQILCAEFNSILDDQIASGEKNVSTENTDGNLAEHNLRAILFDG